ncbi:RrF2 family transcriptional regulator [Microbispora bryophytorum]|uniref:HTH-type transcriptional repressor NsrR n=1 Tax=Microbispora bryophytorum TaxID=1460882 RepID=A0A8H9H0A1_9ACTN|nr:Rrf2 family transcriptional regulator [Microbispora bryophytorum]MBD3140702.1 Rrf2 family transcriptional regulator [Microbispora bryophytorum]TQS04936.1 Rrf2 family transcriptional regulator [Microbispora bryophytorum]GGO16046.1 HTH-type transcriptional repressor NsrR [Microbispora bryophytorum]
MRLTKFTDLALRVTMRLAVLEPGASLTTRQVADAMAIPYNHTAKAIARLQHLGVVEARRGRGGGLELTDFGRTASIGWLVRELEGEEEVVTCEGEIPCPLRAVCSLRGALRVAQQAFYASLDPITVDQLTSSSSRPVLLSLS